MNFRVLFVAGTTTAMLAALTVAGSTGAQAAPTPTPAAPAATTSTAAASPAAAPAAATPAAAPASVATATPLPTVQINGVVWGQATVGNTVYAVGKFTSARPAGAAAGTRETPRANILAYNIRSGVLSTTFTHTLNAQALTVTASPDGSRIYVGGQFTTVDGQNRYRIAAFSTSTGALLPYAPAVNATVATIAVTSTTVYFGGIFSAVNGNARGKMAATNTSGGLLPWAPKATGTVRGLIAVPSASRVYTAGSFSSVNGQATEGVSAVNSTTGASVTVPVSKQIIATSNNSNSAGIYSLRTDGTRIYGTGYNAISASFPQFEGTFALNPATGSTIWVNDCWGDSYDAVPIAGALYVASHAHSCSGAGFFGETGTHYYGLAYGTTPSTHHNVRDARGWDYSAFPTSSLLPWRPTFYGGSVAGQSVWTFTGNGSFVAAGGEFPKVNTLAQQGLVRFAVPGSTGAADTGATTTSPESTGTVTVTAPATTASAAGS